MGVEGGTGTHHAWSAWGRPACMHRHTQRSDEQNQQHHQDLRLNSSSLLDRVMAQAGVLLGPGLASYAKTTHGMLNVGTCVLFFLAWVSMVVRCISPHPAGCLSLPPISVIRPLSILVDGGRLPPSLAVNSLLPLSGPLVAGSMGGDVCGLPHRRRKLRGSCVLVSSSLHTSTPALPYICWTGQSPL
jgi:hypothetical protein